MKLIRREIIDVMTSVLVAKDRKVDPFISTGIVRRIWDTIEDELGLYTHTWYNSGKGWIGNVK